jgi:hypothetical protein
MTNRFGCDLYPKEVRWAAAEGVSEDVYRHVYGKRLTRLRNFHP